jgi:cation diffusion facilitator CzcD-associated flavoprotein CzcO
LWLCGGYYSYKKGYTPNFKGRESFEGQIIHPQEWPKNLNYNDKNVVVIGSGATAVTIVPSMAKKASHVTMLQRSPTYYELAPYESNLEKSLQKFFGVRFSSFVIRWMYILIGSLLFSLSRKYPDKMKKRLINHASNALGKDYAEKHFTPTYNPWDQRLCLIPDGDLFRVINSGKASVVTDHIEKFTKKGIQLKSGKHLNADLIITATGLNLEVLNGIQIKVDDTLVDFSKTMSYKGVMFSDIPNLAYTFGYTNASWTLKADLTSEYVGRLLNYMDKKDYSICCPHADDSVKEGEDLFNLSSGYIRRSIHKFPKQGSHDPWKNMQNYLKDIFVIRMSKIQDKVLKFSTKKSINSLQEPL